MITYKTIVTYYFKCANCHTKWSLQNFRFRKIRCPYCKVEYYPVRDSKEQEEERRDTNSLIARMEKLLSEYNKQ